MLTVLLATLAVTHTAVIGLWVLAGLAILLFVGTDMGLPVMVVVIAPAGASALTVWKWLMPYWQVSPRVLGVDTWLERLGRTILLLLAAIGIGVVAKGIWAANPGVLAAFYILYYITLLYPLFLALHVGLAPRGK